MSMPKRREERLTRRLERLERRKINRDRLAEEFGSELDSMVAVMTEVLGHGGEIDPEDFVDEVSEFFTDEFSSARVIDMAQKYGKRAVLFALVSIMQGDLLERRIALLRRRLGMDVADG